ncbi:MAG: bifunctional tetrahydrofolate synthase/dihydrofolate synthase, partial [Xanthomonadales bacterium]|nr:bifunctional tetrahydrofolate synthase/dihydrofolate synthase [Xanthomonadales bacterium]
MTSSLADWLAYQQHLTAQPIELGLERVRAVWQRLGARRPAQHVITVGGTNGKGSTVAMLEAMLRAGGQRVGCFTSPHLLDYNERIRVDGEDVDDASLVAVFARIESARGDIPLSYFEFGSLAAFEILADVGVDVAVLEVGLGGRLDAVNIIDADAAIVVTVDLDHMHYLGPDRDAIGCEKAGIFRAGRPAIIGDRDPPAGLLDAAEQRQASLWCAGTAFQVVPQEGAWYWLAGNQRLRLPPLALQGRWQIDNAAAALAALYALRSSLPWAASSVAALAEVRVPARLQRIAGPPELIVDVAHNPQAARALADWLHSSPCQGRTLAVFSALADKDIPAIAAAVGMGIDHWYCCAIVDAGARGLDANEVQHRVLQGSPQAHC